MQQLLKLLDEHQYVSRYIVCGDENSVWDIFWTHHKSIKLFNTVLIVLIIKATYNTNKYVFHILEIVDVTSTHMTYLVSFIFLECDK